MPSTCRRLQDGKIEPNQMLCYIILGGEARIMSTETHCTVKLLYKGMLGFGNLRECCSFDSCYLH
jgi:hypothetical protein